MGKATIDFDDLIDAVSRRMQYEGWRLSGRLNPDGSWTATEPWEVIRPEDQRPIPLKGAILDLLVERVAWTLPSENEPEDADR
jgi:hypothetical protein